MRRSSLGWLIASCSFIALLGLRHHFVVLYEVLYTYATFHYQPLNLIDYPDPLLQDRLGSASLDEADLVPKIIHQIYLHESNGESVGEPDGESVGESVGESYKDSVKQYALQLNEKYRIPQQTCKNLHPTWDFRLWTTANGTAFVAEIYPHLLDTFQTYPQTIQRANILRYLLLHHYGGVYLDLDIACRVPLDGLRHVPFVTPGAHPTGVNNAFIMSKPLHPFFEDHLIPAIQKRNLYWLLPYVTNMFSTGCMFISSLYVRANKSDMFLLNGAKYHLRGHSVSPLFEHFGESSWHSWDAGLILWLGNNLWTVLFAFGGVLAILMGLIARRTGLLLPLIGTRTHKDPYNKYQA